MASFNVSILFETPPIIYLDKKLLIKGKVSKICDFFDAEYDVNTVLRLDPHYRT